jgi:hypothetical protein
MKVACEVDSGFATGLHRTIQRGQRFVEDDHGRIRRERASDCDSLTLPAAKLVGKAPRHIERKADAAQ